MSNKIGTVRDAVQNPDSNAGITKRRRSLLPKLLCVLAAFVLWIYVMQVESPEYTETINSIPVELENISKLENEAQLSIYSGNNQLVNVSVLGKRSVISRLSSDSIKAFIDVSKISEPGRHSLNVYVELPDGVSLNESSPSTVTVYADENVKVSLPVKERLSNLALPSPYELGTIELEYNTISVSGPKNKVNSISGAYVNVDMSGKTSSFTANCPITLYGLNGETIDSTYLSLSETDMKVTTPIYISKEIPITTEFKHGLFDSKLVTVTCDPETVTVRGDESVFRESGLSSYNVMIDEKQIDENSITMRVRPTFTEDVIIDPEDEEVLITVKLDNSLITKRFSVSNFRVIGESDRVKYKIIDESINVTLRGKASELSALKASDITAIVDLSGYDSQSSGTVKKNVIVDVASEAGDSLFEVGTYSVSVRIY